MNNISKIQQMQDLYVKIIKNNENFPIKSVPKRFINKEIIEIAYEKRILTLIDDTSILTKVINDDVELWDKIIDKYPDYIEIIPRNYLTDDMLLKAYRKDKDLVDLLLEINPEIVTEDMLIEKYFPLDPKNADSIRKIIKDDNTYKILIGNRPRNIKIMPRDRKELFTYDICYTVLKHDPRLIKYIPKECIPDRIYHDLPGSYVSQLVKNKEFSDNENLYKSTYLKILKDNFSNINNIPIKYINDDLCKSFSTFCNYIISNKDKIDTESVCIDIVVNNLVFENDTADFSLLDYFKDILLLGKKYAGKAIDILIDNYPHLIKYTRYDDINSFDNDFYIKIIKSGDFFISSIPENKITREMYIAVFNHNMFVTFPNHRKDLINDDFCIEYLKSRKSRPHALSYIEEEYRTEKVCLYAYEKSKSNIRHFPNTMIHLFKEDMCIDCLTDHTIQVKYIPEECITAKIVEKAFEADPESILNDKCSKYITKEMCTKLANEYNDLRFINYIDDELLLEMHDIIIDKLTRNN